MPANCPIDSIASTLIPREIINQSKWNWCMNTLWCKIVVIIAIVLAGLLVLSFAVWLIRVFCCGVKTLLCCCCCCGSQTADNVNDRDLEKQTYHHPPNMYYQPNNR